MMEASGSCFHVLDHGLVHILVGEDAGQELGQQLEFFPEAEESPDPLQGDLHVPVRKDQGGAGFVGQANSFEHFRARLDPQPVPDLAVKRLQHELDQQENRLALLDDLVDVHLAPVIPAGHALVSGRAEFHADGVWLDQFHGPPHILDAFQGDMGRADQEEAFVSFLDHGDTSRKIFETHDRTSFSCMKAKFRYP